MAAIQRPSSDMDPLQRSYSRRSLLPVEQQIIDALGLTLDEYWEFCRLADCKAKERGQEYALIPEISATGEPLTSAQIATIVLSFVFTAASVLLAPKPPSLEEGPAPIRTPDVRGQTRFAELYSFEGLQDLATLGSIIPLIFARRDDAKGTGGIRAKGLLIWSQLLSKGSHQELKMLTALGMSSLGLGATPEAEGLAVGDQLLRSYQEARYRAYFLDNKAEPRAQRVTKSDSFAGDLTEKGNDDIYLAFDRLTAADGVFTSGARTPSSQRSFGCHSPISNGAPYFPPYDLVQVFDDEASLIEKRAKINGSKGTGHSKAYSSRQGMVLLERNGSTVYDPVASGADTQNISVNDILTFKCSSEREDTKLFPPHGVEDINTAIDERISVTDSLINVGDLYAFGSSIIKCTEAPKVKPYESGDPSKEYKFTCIEAGAGFFIGADNDPEAEGNAPFGQHLQRIDIATVTNNRKCDQTEIGIKSVVYKRIDGFANVNSEPPTDILEEYEKDKQSFSLGRVSTFQSRYSFFKILYRPVGDSNFIDISSEQIFAVRGSNTQPQYNSLLISHPRGQYEFKILPLPGSTADDLHIAPAGQSNPVHVLTGQGFGQVYHSSNIQIGYTGNEYFITDKKASNDEFIFKQVISGTEQEGSVIDLNVYSDGEASKDAVYTAIEEPRVQPNPVGTNLSGLIYGVAVDASQANQNINGIGKYNGEIKPLGAEYQYNTGQSNIVGVIPAIKRFEVSDQAQYSQSSGSEYFVEVDAGGSLVEARFNGALVSTQTQDPNNAASLSDSTKIYRAEPNGQQFVINQTAESIDDAAEGEQFQPNPGSQYGPLFGVWVDDLTDDKNAFWNGTRLGSQGIPVYEEGQEQFDASNIAYVIVRPHRLVIPGGKVHAIKRRVRTPAGQPKYYRRIQKGSLNEIEPAYNVYGIAKYAFDHERFDYRYVPAEYAPQNGGRAGSGTGLRLNASSLAVDHWQWNIADGGSGYKEGDVIDFEFVDGTAVAVRVEEIKTVVLPGEQRDPLNLKDAIADYPKYDVEKTSHQDGPEHEIVYVNELRREDVAPKYEDLSLLGLRVLAGKDWTTMGQFSAYIQQGIQVERLITDAGVSTSSLTASTNNFAEIAYNLLVSPRLGAGKRVPRNTVDRTAMELAAKFCRANDFTFDGVVGERTKVREFIFNYAALNFLDFTIKGGKFSLTPAVLYDGNYKIDNGQNVEQSIKALFTDGNMKDLQVSFLPPEQRQLFKATLSYREEVKNGFSSQKMIQVRFDDTKGGSEEDPEEFLDMTEFCTSAAHALKVAKYRLLVRKHTDHTITFKTTPSSALGLEAGSYIKVISDVTHASRFNNGSVDAFGGITSSSAFTDGTHKVYFWKPENSTVEEGNLIVEGGKATNSELFGTVFTKFIVEADKKRVYKVDSLTIDDEGYVDIGATHQPLTDSGSLATLDFNDTQFVSTGI